MTPFINIKEGYCQKVTFNTTDGIEQKIDKLRVMMGKLVTEDEDSIDSLNHEYTNPIEVEDR